MKTFFELTDIMNQIKDHAVYKQVMADSFNGIMYNVANQDKYDTSELFSLWDSLTPAEKEMSGGIMKGAFNFLKGND